ncbi:MAG TPA: sialidase family protein, partial [Candidatus Hydrogenedentes bacterium]|nr:sialidase family protein [Candidatus Hydrogenedentota bacterium]
MIMTAAWCILAAFAAADQPFLETALIFDPEQDDRGHVHASCIVACPNGDLRVVWYENGPALPPPYFDKEKDKSADVRIAGSRKPAGADAWESPFVMVDTFGVSDNNPCMVVDNEDRLWLFHAILLGVPESSWGSALLQYRIASDYARPGPPRWDRESALVVHLAEFEDPAEAEHADPQLRKGLNLMRGWLKDPFKRRLGWMPRAHPLIQADGALLLPLANENFTIAAMAFTRDAGETWTFSRAVPGLGLEQPSVVEFPDGAMTAFFRNDRPQKRIVRSDSTDGGVTWGEATLTALRGTVEIDTSEGFGT